MHRNPTHDRMLPPSPPAITADDQLLSFSELARHLSRHRGGRKIATSTIWRWYRDGCVAADHARVRLPAVRLGHSLLTTIAAATWFARRLTWTPPASTPTHKSAVPADAANAVERVAQRLATTTPPTPTATVTQPCGGKEREMS